jgi:threonine dehydrogenase-like Zn-dependent dehydrogenase
MSAGLFAFIHNRKGLSDESMHQAVDSAGPGGSISFVGVPHGVGLEGDYLFFSQENLLGGPVPVRRFLPNLIDLVLIRKINPARYSAWSCRLPM